MELGIFDRLILLNILPKEGDFTTIKIIRKLREELSFSEEEHNALKFQIPAKCEDCDEVVLVPMGKASEKCSCGGKLIPSSNIQWKADADKPKDVQIGEKAMDVIKDTLLKLSKDKKLTEQHLNVYTKFMGE